MMIFSEKLQLIRRNKGITQERLADMLEVSRQAVAKWEAGHSFPDIDNLIKVSTIFHVTLDYLVKDDICMKSNERIDVNNHEITDFLIRAKQQTYAGKGNESESTRPCSHDLHYSEGDFLYIDTYLGGEAFSGEEVVWLKGKPIYAMNYCGRVVGDNFSGDFLKAALLAVPHEMPFRGPRVFQENDYIYRCSVDGEMNWFQGYEEIYFLNTKIYECFFHGGFIR